MMRLADIIEEFGGDFIQKYDDKLLPSQIATLNAIKNCRTIHSPKMEVQCDDCNHQHFIPHSCGNRHCPHCQNHESQHWIEKQLQKEVAADYFMLTFTLAAEFRCLTWQHQRLVYGLFFNAVWETLKKFTLNDKKLGGNPGAITVLHTHSRVLDFHPHIHVVMPGASIDPVSRLWRQKKGEFLFDHKALAIVFRAKFLDALTDKGLSLPCKYPEKWVVDCRHVGKGDKALVYLGRYLYRGVIQEKNILSSKNGLVTFRYEESKTKKTKIKTVPVLKFLWLVLQHVLPRGFRRARDYGFLHPNSKSLIKVLQWVFRLNPNHMIAKVKDRKHMLCSCCGGNMIIVRTRIQSSASLAPI